MGDDQARTAVGARPSTDLRQVSPSHRRRLRAGIRRVRGRMRQHRTLNATWRGAVFCVGALVIVAGLVMLVTPGPGWLGIVVGLAILSTEFDWAERRLGWAKRKARQASAKVFDPAVRRKAIAIGLLVVVVAVTLSWWWVATHGWPHPVHTVLHWLRRLP